MQIVNALLIIFILLVFLYVFSYFLFFFRLLCYYFYCFFGFVDPAPRIFGTTDFRRVELFKKPPFERFPV